MNLISQYIEKFFYNYGFFIVGGAIGAIIHRMRVRMSPLRFIKFLFVAIVLALAAGIICRDIFHLPETTIYVICGVFGAFSEEILDEVEDFIRHASEMVRKKLGMEDVKEDPKKEETKELPKVSEDETEIEGN
jgi:hypothetical protein|nr:MAG TPA: holin [Caudoviricetes sp.]